MIRLALFLLLPVLAGCSSTNISELAKALATSEATVCGKLTLSTPWGTQTTTFARTNIQSGAVACPSEGGLTVNSIQKGVTP